LKQAQQERKASNIKNRSFAIKRLQELLTHKVDWLSVCCVKARVNCSGLNHSQVLHHDDVDLSFCHKHWDYSRGDWRARKCYGSTHLDEETALMLHAVNFSTELTMIKHRRNTASVGLNQLKENASIFGAFKQAALTIDGLGDVSDRTMKKNHSALAKQAFNAYTSFRWGEKFKGDKD